MFFKLYLFLECFIHSQLQLQARCQRFVLFLHVSTSSSRLFFKDEARPGPLPANTSSQNLSFKIDVLLEGNYVPVRFFKILT